jgi:pimeloyl-ACP methyl ester carboxylesterase
VRKTDWQAVGEVTGEALAAAGTLVKDMHEGIASRPFGQLGTAAEPVRVIHDGVSRAVHAGVRGGLRTLARGAAQLAASQAPAEDAPLDERPAASIVLGAINGLYGDRLTAHRNGLALQMEIRHRGVLVPASAEGLSRSFPDATGRLAVFTHGLCETEAAWRLPARGSDRRDARTYGERLQAELGFTPLTLRYNTGLRISRNGRELARLLDEILAAWPAPVTELVLVGHSMGGLVARSACHYAEKDGRAWPKLVRHVFSLGTPHLGADLEKGANVLGWALNRLPETQALAGLINTRSVGIKDLRYGSCVDEDWSDCDPDEFLRDRCQEVPFLPSASYYFVGATLSPNPVGRLLGDLLVRSPSSSGRGDGRGRRIPFEVDNGYELSGLTHFDLLNHPAVYEQLRAWLERGGSRASLTPA